jgi:hypothetical protein
VQRETGAREPVGPDGADHAPAREHREHLSASLKRQPHAPNLIPQAASLPPWSDTLKR